MGLAKATTGKKTTPARKARSSPKAKLLAKGSVGKKGASARKVRSPGKANVTAKTTAGEKAKGTARKMTSARVKPTAKSSGRGEAAPETASPSTTSEASSTLPVGRGVRRSARSLRA